MKTRLLLVSLLLAGTMHSQTIDLEFFADGFSQPVEIVNAGDDRLFVVEQDGLVKILNADGTTNETVFIDLGDVLSTGGERGLLGLAFHPDYETNGYFFVNYTNEDGDTVIARYSRSDGDENQANPDSGEILLTVEQPFSNHNGGCLRFGPDDYLYIGMGDGGSGDDPGNRAQNTELLLGKMLRLDVDAAAPYIPADNPFVGIAGADEIWAYGLRNPWKFSFNRLNGDLWIADVGQDAVEEINKVSPTEAGLNYGWRCYEGSEPNITGGCADISTMTFPFAEYGQEATGGCSVTGGYVYTGDLYPNLQGKYIFTDYCHGMIGIVDSEGEITYTDAFDNQFFTTFGEDNDGELYIAGSATGEIFRIVDTTAGTAGFKNAPFAIYPNQAKNEFFVGLKNGGEASVSIFDVGGKLLVQQSVSGQESAINTSALQSGIYMLTVENEGIMHYQKLVID